MATTQANEPTGDVLFEDAPRPGIGPYRLAWIRLRRNKVALAFGGLFLLVVVLCLLAPVYAHHIAHAGPNETNLNGTVKVGGKEKEVVSATGIGLRPTFHSRYFFGADAEGRDLAVRLLYGGRNSLLVGGVATLITVLLASIIGTAAGYFRGLTDSILSRLLDLIWAYPAVLLGIALGTALATGGIGPLKGNSLLVPAVIVGVVYVPYMAKPIRGQVLTMREKDFIDAARVQGFSDLHIMRSEILPNLASTILVFIPLILANAILLEAGLSYLGAGVQPPNPSWGTMISDGTRFPNVLHLTLVPGIMLVLCVLGMNVFGDGVRDALDPRSKLKMNT